MSSLVRYLFACLLVVAFALQQTGAARIVADDCCPDDDATVADAAEEPACAGPQDGGDCVPQCDDCLRCASSPRILLASFAMPEPSAPATMMLEQPAFEPVHGREARLRLERPPRV